jgi:diketogulonate reductase-like aldo/keto reductase
MRSRNNKMYANDNQISYIKFGITLTISIFIGVLLANVISTEISKGILAREIATAAQRASERLRVESALIKQENIKREELRVQERIKNNQIRQQQSMAQAEQNKINRIHRDNSCKAANN